MKKIYVVMCQEESMCSFTTEDEARRYIDKVASLQTSQFEVRNLRKGDVFYFYGEKYVAAEDPYEKVMTGWKTMTEYVLHDTTGHLFSEYDFPYSKTSGLYVDAVTVYEYATEADYPMVYDDDEEGDDY